MIDLISILYIFSYYWDKHCNMHWINIILIKNGQEVSKFENFCLVKKLFSHHKRLKQCFLRNLYIAIYYIYIYMWLRLVQNSSKLYSYTKKQRCFHKREGGGRNLLYRSQSIPPQSPSHETVKFHIMVMKTRNFFPSPIFLYLFYFLLLFFHFFYNRSII